MTSQDKNTLFNYFPTKLKQQLANKEIKSDKKVVLNSVKSNKKSKIILGSKLLDNSKNLVSNINKKQEVKEFAFEKSKKLPLNTKQQVLSAIVSFWKVKNVDKNEKQKGFEKILKKSHFFNICTMVFKKECEKKDLFSQNSKTQ